MLPVFQPPFPSVYVPPSRTSVTCRARSPHPSNSSISRRTLLAHLLALPLIPAATALPNPNVLDPETGEYEPPELNFHSPLWPTPAETATTTEYLRATQQAPNDDIRHTARIYLARGGVVAFGAAISSIIMSIVERKAPRTPLPSKYDPYILEVYFRMRPDMVIRRCTLFAWEMLSLSFSYALLMLPFASGSESDRRSAWARELREAITRLGPAVIKLGQAAAARPDLFGAPIVRELQMLQDGIVESFSTRDACEVMDEELGAGPEKLFDWFEIMPVAGASLGMVFRASVDDNVVAVKVQRPGVAESVALDCYIVRALASIGTKLLGSRTDFRLAVDEYASRLFEELDYSNELRNIEQFRSLYGDMEGIYLPRVFPQYCSRKVLVTEWVEGVKLIDDDARVRAEDLGLVKTGIRFALTQLLDKGFMHAVLRTKSGYLAYIDFGLVSEVPLSVRESLVVALMHLIHGEYTKLAESFAGLALMGSDDLQLDLPVLSEALRDALQAPSESSVTGFTLVGMVGKLIPLGTRFPFVFNDYFLNNLRCLAMLEGLALNADPTFNILSVVYPYVASKIVTIPRPRYQEALESIIVDSYGRMRWTRMEKLLRDMDVKDSEDVKNNGRKQRKGTAANMVLSFIAGREGRMLRRYIVQQTLVSVEERWRAKVDVMLGRSSAATEENRVEKAARGRTEAFFGSADVGRRMAVWIRIAPGFLWPFMKVVWRVVMHAVKGVEREKKKVVRGTEERERQWSAFDSTFFRRLEAQQALGSDSDAGVILK